MKITKYILSLAAAIGMIAGCQKAELVQMLPADQAVAPVLSDLPDTIKITPLNMAVDSVVFNWTSADFGVSTQVTYAIEVAEKGGATKAIVSSGITDTTAVLYYETINVALFEGLELLDAVATDVEFYVSAYTGESAKIYSAGVPVNATATAAEKTYPGIYVIGQYNKWSDDNLQKLFDFKGTDAVYSGLIGFGGKAADGWKIRQTEKGWPSDASKEGNWGLDGEAEAPAAEAAELTLISDGGSSDIKIYSKNYYNFTFDKSAGITPVKLKVNFSFDQVGVIGVNGDWDNDVVMNFNAAKQKFYADIELTADGNFKFRADAGWDLNWGVKDGVVTAGGDNIEAKAGKYRVYLNLNNPDNITYELNAKAYGIEEGTTPAPEPEPETPAEKTYGLIGNFNDWADPDVDLVARTDGFYVAKAVKVPAGDKNEGGVDENKILIRVNDAWDEKFGFAEADTYLKLGKNTLTAGGNDMWIKEGEYDFYFNPTTAELYLANAGDADPTLPSDAKAVKIYGDVSATGWTNCNAYIWDAADVKYAGDWPGKALEKETLDGKEYYVFNADASMYGKTVNVIFNNGTEQTVDIKGVVLNDDVIIALTEKGTDGKWQATIDGEVPEVPEVPEASGQWYLAGNYKGGSANPADGLMTKEGEYFVLKGVAADGQWMVFTDGTWDNKLSGSFVSADSPMEVVKVTGQESFTPAAGTYDVYLKVAADATSGTAYFMTQGRTPSDATVTYIDPTTFEVGLSGSMNNWGNVYVAAFDTKNITDATKYAGTYTFKLTDLTLDGNDEFKIRIKGDWVGVGKATVEGIEVTGTDNFTTTATGSYNLAISFDWDGQKYSNVKAVFTVK